MAVQDTLQALKELYNYDFENLYYQLIRTMMADYRLQPLTSDIDSACNTKFEQAQIYIMKEQRSDLALPILEDLYLGTDPLSELC